MLTIAAYEAVAIALVRAVCRRMMITHTMTMPLITALLAPSATGEALTKSNKPCHSATSRML